MLRKNKHTFSFCSTFAAANRHYYNNKITMAERKLDNMGLYQSDYEHDACGVGMVVNIHGGKSHDLVDNALKVLENMEHRGAETRDKLRLATRLATEPVSWYRFRTSLSCCRVFLCLRRVSTEQDWYSCQKTRRRSRRFSR